MRCSIALKVNNGESQVMVQRYGAKSLVVNSSSTMNMATFSETTTAPTVKTLANNPDEFNKGASYIFSNNGSSTSVGLSKLKVSSPAVATKLRSAGANLFKDIADDYFTKHPNKVLSEFPANDQRFIVEASSAKQIATLEGRDFLHVGNAMVEQARALVESTFEDAPLKDDDEGYNSEERALFEEGMEFLIVSALYRGFDIVFSKGISPDVINSALNRYNNHLRQGGPRVTYISESRAGKNISRVNNVIDHISNIDNALADARPRTTIDESNLFLNTYISDEDRKVFNKRIKPSNASKLDIANRLIKSFKKMNPNLDVSMISNEEIRKLYGRSFVGKKGFIIENKIVLNLDKFDNSTLFHEFGHFYMKWLLETSPEAHANLLAKVKEQFPEKIQDYSKVYSRGVMKFTEDNIAEEVFVDFIGMKAAKSLQERIDAVPAENFQQTVDKFMDDFVLKITNNTTISALDAGLSLDSSIATIFNIAGTYSTESNPSSLYNEMDRESVKNFQRFFIPQATSNDIYSGLIARGLIREVSPGKIILLDEYGNRRDKDGNLDPEAVYDMHKWDTAVNVLLNKIFLNEAEGYLDAMKDQATTLYSIQIPQDPVKVIQEATENTFLNELTNKYEYEGASLERTTHFLTENFGSDAESEDYAVYKAWVNFIATRRAVLTAQNAEGKLKPVDVEKQILEESIKWMDGGSIAEYTTSFKNAKNELLKIFAFKTDEGTYLHGVAEFYFRALNYANKIDYGTGEKHDYMHYANGIIEEMGKEGSTSFTTYIENNFLNRLTKEQGTPEYIAFKESYDFIVEAMQSKNNTYAKDFLNHLKPEIINKLKHLPGPLTFMPEVKLASKNFGVAGTIDLLVIDGNGVGHIMDYKTKESGKHKWWDYDAGVRMKGVMAAYAENAKMKASIQTSLYKVILMEMGIMTGSTTAFYVDNKLHGDKVEEKQPDGSLKMVDVLDSKKQLRYQTVGIRSEGLTDVSAELLAHFKKNGIQSDLIKDQRVASATMETIFKASGDHNIDVADNIKEEAENIYAKAVERLSKSKSGDNAMYSKALAQLANKAHKDMSRGLPIVLTGFVKMTLPSNLLDNKDASVAAIEELLRDRKDVRHVESELEQVFYTLDRGSLAQEKGLASRDKDTAMRALLADTDSSSYEFVKMSSNASLGLEFSGVTMLKNKITGETRMIILNHDRKQFLKFDGEGRGNIFGNYISTRMAKVLNPTKVWENTNYNMRLVKAGLMMAQQKKMLGDEFKVSLVVSSDEFKRGSLPQLHDLSEILTMTRIMIEQMVIAGEKIPSEITDLIKDPKLFNASEYINNPVESMSQYLSIAHNDLVRTPELFAKAKKSANDNQKRLKEIVDNYGKHQDLEGLLGALHKFRGSLTDNLFRSKEARVNSDLWTLTDNIIMYLHGFNYNTSPKNTSFANNFLVTSSKSSNMYQGTFNRKIQESSTGIREEYMAYKKEHTALIKDLEEYYGITNEILGPGLYESSRKHIFHNLYLTDNKTRNTAFRLKPENHSSLAAPERAYLKYLNKTMQDMTNRSSFSKVYVKEGWMPLMPKSHMSYRADTGFLKQFRDTFNKMRLDTTFFEAPESTIDNEFAVENRFIGQFPTDASKASTNFTYGRRRILGVDEAGQSRDGVEKTHPLENIEDNLENVLDNLVIASLDSHHYRDVSSFGRSMYYNIKRFEKLSGDVSYHNLVETLTLMQRRVINHKESDERNSGIKLLNKFATHAAIAGTMSQALLETFTNPMVTASNYFGDKLYGVMFNGQREFSLGSYSKAFAMVTTGSSETTKLINELDRLYGITSADTANLKQLLNRLESKSLFQSKNLMFVNKMMLDTWQKITMVAYMIEQGSFFAHTLDEDGTLVYDETEDKRYSISSLDTPEEKLKKKKMLAAVKEALANQPGGLTGSYKDPIGSRKMVRAFTGYEANYVKEMIVEIYSSLDETSKSLATYYTWMSFLSKMRTWLFSKIPRYFQQPMSADENKSISRLKRVEDPDAEGGYRMSFEGEPTEGVLYTIQSLAIQAQEHKMDIFKKGKLQLHDKQKKNLSILMGDVLVWGTLSAAAMGVFKYALDDEDRANEGVRLAYDRWMMATGDVFLMKSLIDVTTGNSSMLVGLSIASGAINSVIDASIVGPRALINGEDVTPEMYMEAMHKVGMKVSGPYKTIAMMAQYGASDT